MSKFKIKHCKEHKMHFSHHYILLSPENVIIHHGSWKDCLSIFLIHMKFGYNANN
jgi:hypothetical protein